MSLIGGYATGDCALVGSQPAITVTMTRASTRREPETARKRFDSAGILRSRYGRTARCLHPMMRPAGKPSLRRERAPSFRIAWLAQNSQALDGDSLAWQDAEEHPVYG